MYMGIFRVKMTGHEFTRTTLKALEKDPKVGNSCLGRDWLRLVDWGLHSKLRPRV